MNTEAKNVDSILKSFFKRATHKFPELQNFKEALLRRSKTVNRQPYTGYKKRTFFYQLIYLSLGILFLILSAFIMYRVPTYACHQLLGNCFSLQAPLASFTALFSALSFLLAFTIKTEYEVLRQLTHKAQKKLQRLYALKLARKGISLLFPFGAGHKYYIEAKVEHQKHTDVVSKMRQEAGFILDKIGKSPSLNSAQREELFNQTLLHFEQELDSTIEGFNSYP